MHTQAEEKRIRLYTGSYNAPVLTGDGSIYHGKGRGIQVFLFDEEEGTLEELESDPDAANASWLTFSPDRKTLYAVNELDDYQGTGGGALSAFAVDEEGRLILRNCLPVMGAAPCHVNCDRSGGHVFTANYNGGSVSSFQVDQDGSLKAMDWQIIHHLDQGNRPKGIHEQRQEKPHVHSVSVFDGYLWVTDLGLDEISVYKLNDAGRIAGEAEKCCNIALPAGSGPRSLAFGKDGRVYVSCELSNEIGILHWEGEEAKLEGLVSCTPGEDNGDEGKRGISNEELSGKLSERRAQVENLPGGVIISGDGKYLYVGNRGHDSIGVFRVGDRAFPEGIQWISSGGKNPRGIQISPSGRWVIAANQDSNNMVIFRRDEDTGRLTEHARYEAGAVVCLEFLP